MNRVTYTVIAYLLIVLGFVSLILAMVGLSLKPLTIIDDMAGPLGSFLIKILFILVGFIMFYMSRLPIEDD